MTAPTYVRYTAAGGVATVTLDSEHNRNALSVRLMSQLLDGLRQALADDTVRVVVLTHTGRVFCSGADLKETAGSGDADDLPVADLPELLAAIWEAPKPVLARVSGPARAGGLGLIAAADLAVTTVAATFAFSEVRLGVVPAVISAVVLPRLTPRGAAELFLTGNVFDGRRAVEVGLVTAAVPAAELDDVVAGYLASLLRGGPEALAATKGLLRRANSRDLPGVAHPGTGDETGGGLRGELATLAELSARHFRSAEGREGVAAFATRRDPAWVTG